jgi:hypothetical protein
LVTNCVFSGNVATGGTGGKGAGDFSLGNGGSGGRGGDGGSAQGAAIYNDVNGQLSIFSSTFSSNNVVGSMAGAGGPGAGVLSLPGENGNSGAGLGAAVFSAGGVLVVVNSTFVGNSGSGAVGVAGVNGSGTSNGTVGSAGGGAEGAGVFSAAGSLALTNCVFVENSLVGGVGGVGGTGQTFGFGGDGANGGAGGVALGAGVFTGKGPSAIVNCTFSDNRVIGGPGGLGGAGTSLGGNGSNGDTGQASGAAVYTLGTATELRNSILAFSISGNNAGGPIIDGGYNLSSDTTPALKTAGSHNQIDPGLASFTSFGGTVSTLTLSSNSPAINAITAADGNGAPAFDQRNYLRIAPYDIGAYEYDGAVAMPALQVQSRSSQVLLSWPSSSVFALQTSTDVSKAGDWLPVVAVPVSTGVVSTLSIAPTNSSQFFRLARP